MSTAQTTTGGGGPQQAQGDLLQDLSKLSLESTKDNFDEQVTAVRFRFAQGELWKPKVLNSQRPRPKLDLTHQSFCNSFCCKQS